MSLLKTIFQKKLHSQAKLLPQNPGVYFFKDSDNHILYIGKAKNLKKRVLSYFKNANKDWKVDSIIQASTKIDYIQTKNELEAMLLEAKLIQSNQPKFNILLKSGQPFIYIMISSPLKKLPELKIVRNKKEKGTFWGPFLEKTSARTVYNFLIKTFRLKLCKTKIENGCLEYHLGICAGNCRNDFDTKTYLERLSLAKMALQKGHKNFLEHLKNEIAKSNEKLEFEKSKELHNYYQAFQRVFTSLDTTQSPTSPTKTLDSKDIWILTDDQKTLFLFSEKTSVLRKKNVFYFPFEDINKKQYLDYFLGYYRSFNCPNTILINFDIETQNKKLLEEFLKEWHQKDYNISIIKPQTGHFLNLIRLASIHAKQDIEKQKNLSSALKHSLKLSIEPHTIDCFDISHKQGMFLVGSCVRFRDGQPDKENFRRFKIKTVEQIDDYACLQEIIKRRYKNSKNLPDLILIDGGKGQLNSAKNVLPKNIELISLAKREETIFSDKFPQGKKLNLQNYADQILTALRDYAHHFAISYHRKLAKIKNVIAN